MFTEKLNNIPVHTELKVQNCPVYTEWKGQSFSSLSSLQPEGDPFWNNINHLQRIHSAYCKTC